MDDGLGALFADESKKAGSVSILLVMDDGLGGCVTCRAALGYAVSILLVMDDGLGEYLSTLLEPCARKSLNPSCNG